MTCPNCSGVKEPNYRCPHCGHSEYLIRDGVVVWAANADARRRAEARIARLEAPR